jgi:hypothetical protein
LLFCSYNFYGRWSRIKSWSILLLFVYLWLTYENLEDYDFITQSATFLCLSQALTFISILISFCHLIEWGGFKGVVLISECVNFKCQLRLY